MQTRREPCRFPENTWQYEVVESLLGGWAVKAPRRPERGTVRGYQAAYLRRFHDLVRRLRLEGVPVRRVAAGDGGRAFGAWYQVPGTWIDAH